MPPVQLGPIASTFLVVFYILVSLVLVVLLGALVFIVLRLNALLEKYEQKIDPLLAKADTILSVTNEKVNTLGTKAEEILTQSEELTELVHTRVDTTTYAVQRTVFTPLIGVNSLIAGFKRGAETFARRQQNTLNGGRRESDADAVAPIPSVATPRAAETALQPLPELNNLPDVNQSTNITGIRSVNNVMSNGAELQTAAAGSRKENG